MNRPTLPEYVNRSAYTVELEKYCDYLERRNKTLNGSNNFLRVVASEMNRGLDKACDMLELYEKSYNPSKVMRDADEWRVWALDESD